MQAPESAMLSVPLGKGEKRRSRGGGGGGVGGGRGRVGGGGGGGGGRGGGGGGGGVNRHKMMTTTDLLSATSVKLVCIANGCPSVCFCVSPPIHPSIHLSIISCILVGLTIKNVHVLSTMCMYVHVYWLAVA